MLAALSGVIVPGGVLAPVAADPMLAMVLLSPWARIAAFVWGALWGSFANVVIHRVPRGSSVLRPRSRCPSCERSIAGYDNIPIVSWLVLRGRCRWCKAAISARYPIVEALAGVLSFALYVQHVHVPLVAGGDPDLAPWLLWFAFGLALLVVTYIDLDFWIIPDVVVLPMAVLGFIVAALAPEWIGTGWVEAIVAAATGYLLFAGIRALYLRLRGIEALGLGDAKLLVMIGAFTGVHGLAFTVAAGAFQGVLVAVPMLLAGRNVANTDLHDIHGDDPLLGTEDPDGGVTGRRVPFGPFLALAALEYVMLREHIDAGFHWLVAGAWP